MLEFGSAQFNLSKPDKATGKSRLKLLNEIYEQTGILAPELERMPDLPYEATHVWRWFLDLSATRSVGFDLNPISWMELQAYFTLRHIHPSVWEVDALRRLDEALMESRQDKKDGAVVGAGELRARLTGKARKGQDNG